MRPGRHFARVVAPALLLWLALAHAHVPTYTDSCEHNCCHPPHVHTTSQVVYLEGSGGLELDTADLNVAGNEVIEFNVVFRERYDPTTYQVFVGCGGCASDRSAPPGAGWDPVNYSTNLLPVPMTYQPGVLEPFTQTGYFELLPEGEQRKYYAGDLKGCDSPHWSIRILTHNNASETFRWGAVLGCEGLECEIFTLGELISFPIYVNRNHGHTWNDMPASLPVIAIVVGILYIVSLYIAFDGFLFLYAPVSVLPPRFVAYRLREEGVYIRNWQFLPCVRWKPSLRCALYCIATYAMIVDLLETLLHFFVALGYLGDDHEPQGIGIFVGAVFLFGKVAPLVLVSFIWFYSREIPEFVWRTYDFRCVYSCCGPKIWQGLSFYSPMWAHGAWSIIELLFVGLAGFVWLGAGYFVFPICMTIASIVRMYLWLANPTRYGRGRQARFPMQFNCDPELTQQLLNEYNYSYSNNRDPVRTPLLAGDEPAPPQRPDRAQSAPGALNRAAVSKPGILTAPQADANDDAPPEAAAPAAAPPAVVLPSYIYPEPFKEEKPRPQLQPPSKAEQQKAIAPITQELRGIFARRGSGAGASAGSSLLPPLTRLWR